MLILKKKKDEISIRSSAAEYLTYVASIGDQSESIEMRYEDENIWLTQKLMAVLYDVTVSAINQHIKTITQNKTIGIIVCAKDNKIILEYCSEPRIYDTSFVLN